MDEELRIIIGAENLASPAIDAVTASVAALNTQLATLQTNMSANRSLFSTYGGDMSGIATHTALAARNTGDLVKQYGALSTAMDINLARSMDKLSQYHQRLSSETRLLSEDTSRVIQGTPAATPRGRGATQYTSPRATTTPTATRGASTPQETLRRQEANRAEIRAYEARRDATLKAEQATRSHTRTTRTNTTATQQQSRMLGFAAREFYGLRLGVLGAAASAVIFGHRIAEMLVDTSLLGEEIRNVEIAFEHTFQGEAVQSVQMLEKMRTASKGLMSDLELMRTAVFVAQFPFENLKNLLPEIIEASTNLALAQGKDIPMSIDDMVRALGRGSSKILDNLGIILKVEQAQAEYARQLGKTTEQLTEKERAESFAVIGTQMLIEKGQQYTDLSKDTEASLVRLENAWHNFARTLSENNGVIIAIINDLRLLLELIDDLYENLATDPALSKTWYWISGQGLQDTIHYYQHGAYGDKLPEAMEQRRRETIHQRYQDDPSANIQEKLKETERLAREEARAAGAATVKEFYRQVGQHGIAAPVPEDPTNKEQREIRERKEQRASERVLRVGHETQLRRLEQDIDAARKYLQDNKSRPEFDPIRKAKEAIDWDPSKTTSVELDKEVQRQLTVQRRRTELWETATRTIEEFDKENERLTKQVNKEHEKHLENLRYIYNAEHDQNVRNLGNTIQLEEDIKQQLGVERPNFDVIEKAKNITKYDPNKATKEQTEKFVEEIKRQEDILQKQTELWDESQPHH